MILTSLKTRVKTYGFGLHILFVVFLLMVVLSPTSSVHAAGDGDSNVAAAEINANPEGAVARLSDSEVRRLLLERLTQEEARPESSFNPAMTAWRLQKQFGIIQKKMGEILAAAPELPGTFPRALAKLNQDRGNGGLGQFVIVFLVSLAIGGLVEFLLRRQLRDQFGAIAARSPTDMFGRMRALGFLFTLDGVLVVSFLMAAVISYFTLSQGDGWFRTTFVFYMGAVFMIRLIMIGSAAFLSPANTHLRVPVFTDDDVSLLRKAIMTTVVLGAFGFFTCALFGTLGISGDVHTLFLIIVGTIITTGLMATVMCGHGALTRDLMVNEATGDGIAGFIARAWPWLFAVLIAVIWIGVVVSAFLDRTPLYGAALFTIGLLFVAPSILAALEREAGRRIDSGEEVWAAVLRATRIGLGVLVLVFLAVAWRLDFTGLGGDGLGGQVSNALFQIAVTLLLTYICWQAARIWIDRRIAEEDAAFADQGIDISEMEIGGTGLSRIRTLLPLIKRSIQIVLSAIAFIIVLSALGVDIGPVLAGAGVVGLAIGFGSQALVRDIVSGIFFLVDDAFRLGEYVDVGEVKGSVEKISIRSFQLRHHLGAVNTIPFGEIKTISNYSRDWAIMKLPFRISFGTDINKVRKVIKQVGLDLLEHPDVGEDFIQPFKSQGVLEVDDYGLIVRAKFMCKPGRQFLIRRYAFMGVQQAFAENGIEFARPEIMVRTDDDDDDDDAREKKVEAGAAAISAMKSKGAAETKDPNSA